MVQKQVITEASKAVKMRIFRIDFGHRVKTQSFKMNMDS